jgi:glycosyltransferase involved in cell wall biosynthesis
MSVYNGAGHLEKTVKSILNQTFTDLEFIVVNDGSTDRSGEILDLVAAQDSRMCVVHQGNAGLTGSLIRGCAVARGKYIARQDAGDVSLSERLEKQKQILDANEDVAMVACGVEFYAPSGELLYVTLKPGGQLDEGIRKLKIDEIAGPPHHGGTMFRSQAYHTVGGYREEFRFAQDIDLWLRISEVGPCWGNDEVLYQASVDPQGISMRGGPQQFYFAEVAIQSAKLRRSGASDAALLDNINEPQARRLLGNRRNLAAYYYYIASALGNKNKVAARAYLRKALRENPLHFKALIRSLTWRGL